MTHRNISAIAVSALALLAGAIHAQPMKQSAPASAQAAPRPQASATAAKSSTAIQVGTVAIQKDQIDTLVALMALTRGIELKDLPPQQADVMRKLVATNLIGQELLALEAKAAGIQATAREIDSALAVLKSQFPDEASYEAARRRSADTDAEIREKIARQIRADKVLTANLKQPTMPTEQELRAFWEKNKGEFPVNDSLRAIQILLKADAKAPATVADEKRRTLEALRRDLARDSANTPELLRRFMTEAARISEGPEARIGGDLERFHPGDFQPEFRRQVMNLRVGQLSPVFRTPLGFHLLLLIEKYDGQYDSYRLQSLQNLMAQKNLQLGSDMRVFLKKLAAKYPVRYHMTQYKDESETGIY